MEGQSNQEVLGKTTLRAEQRKKVWGQISNPAVQKDLQEVLSGNFQGGKWFLKDLANSLGSRAYPVLFDLASTSQSVAELGSVFSVIGHLRDVGWPKKSESKALLFERLNYSTFTSTRASQEAQQIAQTLLDRKSIAPFFLRDTRGREIFKQYMIEAVFIALSSPSHPQSTKESILNSLGFFITNREAFDQGVSFWRYTDGSWTNPDLGSASSAKDKNPSSERKTNEDFNRGSMGKEGKPGIFEILGLPPTETAEKVRSAYRKRLFEVHPDSLRVKLEKEGASLQVIEEAIKAANKKTKELNEAYGEYQKTQTPQ